MTRIEDVSEEELTKIVAFLSRQPSKQKPRILVGGWAVFSYNPYAKSVDIDLALSASDRRVLLKWLRAEQGFLVSKMQEDGWRGAYKRVDGVGEIVVDLASFDKQQKFENRQETLGFDLAIEHHVFVQIAGFQVAVPTRSLLLLYKAKAAWDRGQRLHDERSLRPDWEAAKLRKDHADLAALLDPEVNAPWDLQLLAERLHRHDFLLGVLQEAIQDQAAMERYRAPKGKIAASLNTLIDLLGLGT